MPGLPGGGPKTAPVFIGQIAIWGTDLPEEEVKAIYHATHTCAATDSAIESGYISEPPRLRIRSLDNATGSYPSVNRVGDRDFKGTQTVSFDDLNTLVYGSKIVDEFSDLKDSETFSKRINSNKWKFTTGMEIRRETLSGYNGSTFEDGVLVFKGAGTRFIQTKRRVLNTGMHLELIQGPHNLQATAHPTFGSGLKLERGTPLEKLEIQYSITGGAPWTTVKTFTPQPILDFYELKGENPISQEVNASAQPKLRLRKKVDIHSSEFKTHGRPYYIRIVQTYSTENTKAVWGIGRIEIHEINQQVRYPLLVDHDSEAGRRVATDAIQTPHTRSDLVTTGRTLPHASDHFRRFTPGENISPFQEHLAVEDLDPTNVFHAIGSSPSDGIPGFSRRLADKTKLTIVLEQAEGGKVTLGHQDNTPVTGNWKYIEPESVLVKSRADSYNFNQLIMGLYAKKSKGYVRRGLPPMIADGPYADTVNSWAENFVHLG